MGIDDDLHNVSYKIASGIKFIVARYCKATIIITANGKFCSFENCDLIKSETLLIKWHKMVRFIIQFSTFHTHNGCYYAENFFRFGRIKRNANDITQFIYVILMKCQRNGLHKISMPMRNQWNNKWICWYLYTNTCWSPHLNQLNKFHSTQSEHTKLFKLKHMIDMHAVLLLTSTLSFWQQFSTCADKHMQLWWFGVIFSNVFLLEIR